MLNDVVTFFEAGIGEGFLRHILTMLNIALLFAGLALSASARIRKKPSEDSEQNTARGRPALKGIAFAVLFYATLIWLYFVSRSEQTSAPAGGVMGFIVAVFDVLFGVRSLPNEPFPYFSGANLAVRAVILYVYVFLIRYAWRKGLEVERQFRRFLEKRMETIGESDEKPRKDADSDTGKAVTGDKEDKSKKSSEKAGHLSGDKLFILIAKILSAVIVPGGIITYVFGEESTQESIRDVLESVWSFLKITTLAGKIDLVETGIGIFLSNFMYVILSLCILAVYLTIILSIVTFLIVAWENRREIKEWVRRKGKYIVLGLTALVLIVLACTVVFAIGSEFRQVHDFIAGIFSENGPENIAGLLAKFLLLILSLCAVALFIGFFIVFSIFIACFGYFSVKSGLEGLRGSNKNSKHAATLAVTVLGIGAIVGLGYAYDAIREGLHDIFSGGESVNILWVIGHVLIFLGIVLGTLLAVSFVLGIIKQIFLGLKQYMTDLKDRAFAELLDKTVARVIETLGLIPFALKHLVRAVRGLVSTILRIFIGYSTQSHKNSAIFTAACFASLASLLNTFLGLYGFYRTDETLVPMVCSLAIACAVQLAMLIFGMKAGEGIAERMIAGTANGDNGVGRAIVSKCTLCACYALAMAGAGYSLYRVLESRELKPTRGAYLAAGALLILSLLLVRAIIFHILDIRAIIKNRPKNNEDMPDGVMRPRRLSSGLYLAAYLLLMIVSTGFAFNNLFGYYADSSHIHQKVYDQVRDEADTTLNINDRVLAAVNKYQENGEKILENLNSRADTVTQKINTVLNTLDQNVSTQKDDFERQKLENAWGRFKGDTDDFNSFYAALKTYLEMDYDSLNDLTITVETYSHYWRLNPQPSYKSSCIIVKQGEKETSIGKKNERDAVEDIVIDGETLELSKLLNRVKDPDAIDQTVAVEERTINGADKYMLIEELLTLFEQIERNVNKYNVNEVLIGDSDTTQSGGTDGDSTPETQEDDGDIRELINENAVIDSVRSNLAKLYLGDEPSETTAVLDMPRIVDAYLRTDDSGTGEEGEKGSPSEKELAYLEMSDYIDRVLSVDAILKPSDYLLAEKDDEDEVLAVINDGPKAERSDGDGTDENSGPENSDTYNVRSYRNYAQGITYSNFQISYDALLRGSLGLNAHRENINALYSSNVVAVFIMIICALVDMMAFFSGLLLFKNIYLFKRTSELNRIGYLNLEAGLTEIFSLPNGNHERQIMLTLMYDILYGADAADMQSIYRGKRLGYLLASGEFEAAKEKLRGALETLGIDYAGSDNLQLWLMSFVRENNISFDSLFKEDADLVLPEHGGEPDNKKGEDRSEETSGTEKSGEAEEPGKAEEPGRTEEPGETEEQRTTASAES